MYTEWEGECLWFELSCPRCYHHCCFVPWHLLRFLKISCLRLLYILNHSQCSALGKPFSGGENVPIVTFPLVVCGWINRIYYLLWNEEQFKGSNRDCLNEERVCCFLIFFSSRTARGFECGAALTLVCPSEEDRLRQVEERLSGEEGLSLSF